MCGGKKNGLRGFLSGGAVMALLMRRIIFDFWKALPAAGFLLSSSKAFRAGFLKFFHTTCAPPRAWFGFALTYSSKYCATDVKSLKNLN